MCTCVIHITCPMYICMHITFSAYHSCAGTANPTWDVIFESSKLKARMSLSPRFSEKRRSSFELWALKQYSKMSPQVGLAVCLLWCVYVHVMCICAHVCYMWRVIGICIHITCHAYHSCAAMYITCDVCRYVYYCVSQMCRHTYYMWCAYVQVLDVILLVICICAYTYYTWYILHVISHLHIHIYLYVFIYVCASQ